MQDFNQVLVKMQEIHDAKSNDYASNEDEFGNFIESERVGVPAHIGSFIRMQDKYTRCCNLLSGKEQKVEDEKVQDTLMDLANYAIITLCLYNKKQERMEQAERMNGLEKAIENYFAKMDQELKEQGWTELEIEAWKKNQKHELLNNWIDMKKDNTQVEKDVQKWKDEGLIATSDITNQSEQNQDTEKPLGQPVPKEELQK